jgi:ABC-type polysaccharide/polyol phosphate transport system ATPase subunit
MPPSRARRELIERQPHLIEVRDVRKTFRIPEHKVDTIKERVSHPLRRVSYRELHALRGITFDVHRGEFFGIVGRNGSGKSTLLKVLASIYRADTGRIRMAGRLAPFIELGVGFNPELTARENVALNGVMMGLGRREARRRLDAVLDFAELAEFTELKLKNYSSGMMVRLAFAVMVQADADVMLVDEVLAVGDAAFAQKCTDVFREKQNAGKTLVLVTHDMAAVQAFCDRAMLIHDGEQRYLGDPEEAALRYYRLNFARDVTAPDGAAADGPARTVSFPDVNVTLVECWLADERGARVEHVEQGKRFSLTLVARARQPLDGPRFNFHCLNATGNWVFTFDRDLSDTDGRPRSLAAGETVRIVAEIENPLVPGRYTFQCWISRSHGEAGMGLHIVRLLDFAVYGTRPGAGSIAADTEVRTVIEPS